MDSLLGNTRMVQHKLFRYSIERRLIEHKKVSIAFSLKFAVFL